jgi:putative transposase
MSKKTAIAVRKALSATGEMTVRAQTRTELLASRQTAQKVSQKARTKAMSRDIICNYVDELQLITDSLTLAVELLLSRAAENKLPVHIQAALQECASGKSIYPSRSAICGWHKAKRDGGLDNLVSKHKGKQRNEGGWEALATKLYNQPSKPSASSVHKILTEQHYFLCSYAQVNNYLTALPAQLGAKSAARLGKNLHRLTQQAFVRRTTENLRAGDVYVADGYRADMYLAHPITGDIFRPELTVSMDLRSRFIVGWRLDEHEGGHVVQTMWAETFAKHNHVPPLLYVDNGSGYKNSFMDDENTGFYARAGVMQIIHSIPGNPHGKGWIERFFRTMKDDFLKNWMPDFYCGSEMADEVRNKIVREVKAKRLTPPSVGQFSDAFNAWLERHHARPHPEDKTTTPKELWAGLVAIPPAMSLFELKLKAVELKVKRAAVKHGKLEYTHPELHAFNDQKVILEFDMMNNEVGVIRTLIGVWICDASLITPIDVIPVNRLEEKRTQRASDAVKRLQKKVEEQVARSGVVIDAEVIADNALALTCTATAIESDEELILDLTGGNYGN